MKTEEKTKIIKINGVDTKIILPPKLKSKEMPKELESSENHPKGLFLAL
jgi:hypothetical protein